MGFICERYNDNHAGLTVGFRGNEDTDNYFSGDSVAKAMEYFNLYVKDGAIFAIGEDAIVLEATGVKTVAEAAELREKINGIISDYTDEKATENIILFPAWMVGKEYKTGERIRYDGKLYKVLQVHTSQADWKPDEAVSLYSEILTGEGDEPKPWVQPGSTNPYMTGDKVIFEGHVYESLIDNNVWSPAAYPAGWKQID